MSLPKTGTMMISLGVVLTCLPAKHLSLSSIVLLLDDTLARLPVVRASYVHLTLHLQMSH